MSRPLYRRVAKLEAVSRPPMRIIFEYVYEDQNSPLRASSNER